MCGFIKGVRVWMFPTYNNMTFFSAIRLTTALSAIRLYVQSRSDKKIYLFANFDRGQTHINRVLC